MTRWLALGCLVMVGCGSGADRLQRRITALEEASQNTLRAADLQKEVENAFQRFADVTLQRVRKLEEERSPTQRIEDLEYTNNIFRKDLKQEIEEQKAESAEIQASIREMREVLNAVDAKFEEMQQAILLVAKNR